MLVNSKNLCKWQKTSTCNSVLVHNKLLTNSKEKKHFNDFFRSTMSSALTFENMTRWTTVDIDQKNILQLIQDLNSQICDRPSIMKPSFFLFGNCLSRGSLITKRLPKKRFYWPGTRPKSDILVLYKLYCQAFWKLLIQNINFLFSLPQKSS